MEQAKRVVDLSAFFLVEGIGDSEGDLFDPNTEAYFLDAGGGGGRGGGGSGGRGAPFPEGNNVVADDDAESRGKKMADDDAESCSNSSEVIHGCHVHDDDDDGDDKEDEEDNGIGMIRLEDKNMGRGENHNKDTTSEVKSTARSHNRRKCVDSRKEKMSEMEKNRLFWEACLAS